MRKIVLALAAVAALGLTLPMVTAPAEAHGAKKVVVIKKNHHWNRGHHYGWNKHRHHNNHGHHYGHRHGATVVVR
jgi:Ni/Co efflux regulator RcnB